MRKRENSQPENADESENADCDPCTTCENTDRNECKCPQDCHDCNQSLWLKDGYDWPTGRVRCWSCQNDRIKTLEDALSRIASTGN